MPNPTGKGGFRPGESGNRKGRPKGALTAATRLRREIEAHGDAILKKQIETALKGNPYVAKFLLELILPRAKSLPLNEPVTLTGDLPEQAERVKALLAEGRISIDESFAMLDVIGRVQSITDQGALTQRLTEIEAKLAQLIGTTAPAASPALPAPKRGNDDAQ
jgi:hypothetical protein